MFRTRHLAGWELRGRVSTNFISDMIYNDSLSSDIKVINGGEYDLDKIVSVVDYIMLETTIDALIGDIDKLLIHNNKIYIMDIYKSKSIFIFSCDGKFISRISNYGTNNNEYLYLMDMEIDTITQQLVLYDRNGGKLLFYDLNGNFIKTKPLGFRFSNFKIFPNGNYLFFTDNNPNEFVKEISEYSLLIGALDGTISYRALQNEKFLKDLKFRSVFNLASNGNALYVSPRLLNSIYQIEEDGILNLIYQLHFPSGNIELYKQLNHTQFSQEIANKEYYYSLGGHIVMSDAFFYFEFVRPKNIINKLWYNRDTKVQYCIERHFSTSGKIITMPRPLLVHNNQCIGVINAIDVVKVKSTFVEANKKYHGTDKISDHTLQRIEAIKEDDNPLLMIYSINWDNKFSQ